MNHTNPLERLEILFLLILALSLQPLLHLAQDAGRKPCSRDLVVAKDLPDILYTSSFPKYVNLLACEHGLNQADSTTKPVRRAEANSLAVCRRIGLKDHADSRQNSTLWRPGGARCENHQTRPPGIHVERLIDGNVNLFYGLGVAHNGYRYGLGIGRTVGDGGNSLGFLVTIVSREYTRRFGAVDEVSGFFRENARS